MDWPVVHHQEYPPGPGIGLRYAAVEPPHLIGRKGRTLPVNERPTDRVERRADSDAGIARLTVGGPRLRPSRGGPDIGHRRLPIKAGFVFEENHDRFVFLGLFVRFFDGVFFSSYRGSGL